MKKLLLSLLFVCVAIPSLAQSGGDTGGTVVEGTPSGGSGSGSFTGGTLSNPLFLSEDPTTNAEAVTLRYFNTIISPISAALPTYVPKSGATMTGVLTLNDASPAASQAYVSAHGGSGAFNGGTITNPLVLPADPTTNLQAATKAYVDAHAAAWLAGGTLTGNLTLHADPTTALQAATKQYVDAHASTPSLSTLNGLYSSTAYTSATGTIISTTFNEGSTGSALTGTHPATNVPGNAWLSWPSGIASLTYKSGGGATGSGAVSQANIINTGQSNYTVTFSGLTNTATQLVVFRYTDSNNYLSLWLLGSGGVSLEEAVGGTTTVIANDTIANGATGSIVVTVNGNSVTATPFGGSSLTYTIPGGHTDAVGTYVGYFATPGSVFTLGGLSVSATQMWPSTVSCAGYLNADGTCSTAGPSTLVATDNNGHLAPLTEKGTTTVTLAGQAPATSIAWQDDLNAGIYDPRDPRWAGGVYGSTPAAAAQAMSNQMACDLAMGKVQHAVAKWPQGSFPIDHLLIAPGSSWEGTAQGEGGTTWTSTTNNHFMAQAPVNMTVTCSDGLSHTDSAGFTHIDHFTLDGCANGGCSNAAGDTASYTAGGPGNTGIDMQTDGVVEHVYAQFFGGFGIRISGQDAKTFHDRLYSDLEWYYFGGYKGVQETAASTEIGPVTTTGSTSSVTLGWTPVAGAVGYVVYRGTSSGNESTFYLVGGTSFTDTGAAGTSGSVTNVSTSSLAIPTGITASGATTGGTLAAGNYYYKITAYGADGWHGSIEFAGLDVMADWVESYGLFDAPTRFTYHHLADVLGGGGNSHFDHLWPQLGLDGIAQPYGLGAGDTYENVRIDFTRLEGFYTEDLNISVIGGMIDGSCTATNAATINTGQVRANLAGTCDQLLAVGSGTNVSDVTFTDNNGFGPTFKTADISIDNGRMHGVSGVTQVINHEGVMSGGGYNYEPQSRGLTNVTGVNPSVLGLWIINPSDTSPVTETGFTNVAVGQDFYVVGGNGNVTIQNNSRIVTCSGQNINLGSVAGILHFQFMVAGTFGFPATVREVCSTLAPQATAASSETVTFSATPTFSTSFRSSIITMTSNVTSFTLPSGSDGQEKTLIFCQDGSGSRSVTPPSNVHGFMAEGTTASKCSAQHFTYSSGQSAWLADSSGVINE